MSTASPENQMQLPVEGIIHKVSTQPPSSPPELTAMTNVVSVLDLHKADFPNETKIYDKSTNTVYVYSSAPPPPSTSHSHKIDDSSNTVASSSSPTVLQHQQLSSSPESQHQHQQQQQLHQVVINQHPSDLSIDNALKDEQFELMQEANGVMLQRIVNDHLVAEGTTGGGRMVHTITADGRGGEQQILTKISASDDSLFRLIESNQLVSKLVGENQQIISRDIINGEHHIITRNENGEHILTRIVNTSAIDHAGNAKINGELFNSTIALTNATAATSNGTKVIDDGKTQIIYDASNGGGGGVIKASPYESHLNSDVQKQIDLIYEDGNKTVIYTTPGGATNASSAAPDSPHDDDVEGKGLELFSASGECLNGTQVIVQGNLQYTPQIQPDGTTVYVVSEIVSDLNG